MKLPARLRSLARSPLVGAAGIALLVSLLVVGLKSAGLLEFAELSLYDWYVRIKPAGAADSRIVLITVSDRDIESQGKWPLTDATVSSLLRTVLSDAPCAVGLDIYRDMPVPPGTAELEQLFREHRNIVVPTKFGGEQMGVAPPRVLKDTEQVGFTDVIVDAGGVVRRGLLFLDDGRNVYYSIGLRLALIYLGAKGVRPEPDPLNPEYLRLGGTTILPLAPDDGGYVRADTRGYQFLLDYRGAARSFPSYSLTDVLDRKVKAGSMSDRIVIIGTTAEGVKDFFFTPFSTGRSAGGQVPGIVLHGYVVDQLLRTALGGVPSIRTVHDRYEEGFLFLCALAGSLLGIRLKHLWNFSLVGILGFCLLALAGYLLLLSSVWFPVVPAAVAWMLSIAAVAAYVASTEKRERKLLMHLFSRHVSPSLARIIWEERDQFLDGGRPKPQKLTATVLFTDLQGFTAVGENMTAQQVMEWLNICQEAMAGHVLKHGGVVDDYAGDGLKADFGVPVAHSRQDEIRSDAVSAVQCALEMEKEVDRLNEYLQQKKLPAITLRIGVFTGPVVVGCLGNADRLKYTTVGDTVNVASRLESLDRSQAPVVGRCRILIGESTCAYLDNRYLLEPVGEVRLKGKRQTVRAYRLVGLADVKQAGSGGQDDKRHP